MFLITCLMVSCIPFVFVCLAENDEKYDAESLLENFQEKPSNFKKFETRAGNVVLSCGNTSPCRDNTFHVGRRWLF